MPPDYATRFPEAIPLKTIDASRIAEELVKFFSKFGVREEILREEILTDQGSITTTSRNLHIHPIRTTPYHPQTDGLVERFNKTLKSMLRKAATQEGKDWDRLIPHLLFAYREVPQSSTGFSPFELLYGRKVRGPLEDAWENSQNTDESVISYVLTIRERLAELVKENMEASQKLQKQWYDKKAKDRDLKGGDQVLVLLPTSSSKLLAKWQGPYAVVKKTSKVNYLIDMHNKKKRKRVFHVNLLKKFYVSEQTVGFAQEGGK